MESLPFLLAKISERQVSRATAPSTVENEVTAVLVGVVVAFAVLMMVSFWKIFQKAGKPGWLALIPCYNTFAWVDFLGRPLWFAVLQFVPFLNILAGMFLLLDTAKCFGKKTGFAIGLIFLPFVFLPILAFGRARFLGPVTDDTSPTTIG